MQSKHHTILGLTVVMLMLMAAAPVAVTPMATSFAVVSMPVIAETYEWQTFDKNMNVTTFVSPDGSTEQLWKFLNSAEESIYVEIYGINNPNILDLIHELHDTKPTLDMKFLIGEGSLGYYSQNDYVANNLTELGYEVKWTSDPDFRFAHQKFLIIDNETTIVHSGNWAKTSFPESNGKANREWSIAMTDTDVAEYYASVFDGDWTNGTYYNAGTDGTGDTLTYSYTTTTYPKPFAAAGEFSGQMKVTPILSPDTSLQGILYCINSAQATLDIQIPYFSNVDEGGSVNQIVDAILAANDRGVSVRVITEEAYDWELVEDIFIEHDIPIVYQDTRWFTANHNKGIIVDGRIVLISSINYSDNSIKNNREAGVIIENEDIAQWYQEIYDYDWSIADNDGTHEVTVYWTPNIPTSTSAMNVTVYGHSLYDDIDEVELDVKINDGTWSNNTITTNIFESAEEDEENYFYVIPAQADMTNITVVGRIRVGATWHTGVPMVIRVRNSIASPTITPSTTPTTTTDPLAAFMAEYGIWIAVLGLGAFCGGGGAIAYKKGMIPGAKKKKPRRKRKKK